MDEKSCPSCGKIVNTSWKYCRYCGNPVDLPKAKEPESKVEEIEEEGELNKVIVNFDKDLYYKVLSTRSERAALLKEKEEIKENIQSLLEQVTSGVTSREFALPKIKEFKDKVAKVTAEEEKFKDLPTELPVELLVDQMNAAKDRIKKIDLLKEDPALTKEGIKEAKLRAEEAYKLLRSEYSTIVGHLRTWHNEIETKLQKSRKELEQLYIRMKTGELTEEAYEEKKISKAKEIQTLADVERMIKVIIKN